MTEACRGPADKALVLTSRDLLTWDYQTSLEFIEYSEGQSEILGNAQFKINWGEVSKPGDSVSTSVDDPTSLNGKFVCVCQQVAHNDPDARVIHGDDIFKQVWYGKMLSPKSDSNGKNGVTVMTAAGIATVLNERVCWMGRSRTATSPVLYSIAFELAPFNHWPSGDRSTATYAVGGVAVYGHDGTITTTGNSWTARQILDYLMACNFRVEHPPTPAGTGQAGLNWSISDPRGCLDYIPERYDAKGKTLMQAWNELAGKKRGLMWWITVAPVTNVLKINVDSGVVSAITVGTTVIPANPNVWDQTDSGDPFISPFNVQRIDDQVADEIVVKGSPRTIGITLAIYGAGSPFVANSASQLDKGWTTGVETGADAALDEVKEPSTRAIYDHAYRRFVLKAEGWTGDQFGGTGGMPWALVTATNASYGANGWDGSVTSGAGGGKKPAAWYKANANLPCDVGFTALNVGPRRRAILLAEDYTAGSWFDHSSDWQLTVETSPPAVLIDDHQGGAIIRGILRSGRKIIVTLALEDFFPFQVSWRRDPADWPSVIPRTKTIEVPSLSQEYLMNGMATGCDYATAGSLITTTQVTTKDNLVQLRAMLAQARAWYTEPYQIVTFTDRGVWDSRPEYGPGTILGSVIDWANTTVVEAVVSRRTVRLEYASGADGIKVPYWSTTFETDIVYPDMEAVL